MPYWFEPTSVTVEIGGTPLSISTGKIAKQAQGSALVTYGDTVVLVTATHAAPRPGIDFFPLTVDFIEKYAASGKIPGSFFRREARLSDREVLVSRFIDRSIRPLFPSGYRNDTQITCTVLSASEDASPDVAAFIGASAALHISEIPFEGPIAALRVGRVGGELVANPTPEQLEASDIELIVAGNRGALVMVEGEAKIVPEAEMLAALEWGHKSLQPIIEAIDELRRKAGKPKLALTAPRDTSELAAKVRGLAQARLDEAVRIKDKHERSRAVSAIEKEIASGFVAAYRQEKVALDSLEAVETRRQGLAQLEGDVKEMLHDLRGELMRERVLRDGVRIDGRTPTDIRPIACEVRAVPRPHGVALFTRGETQAMVTTTLGSGGDEQTIDAMLRRYKKNFYLHYNFPGFSVGEARPNRGPGRREVGHGNLAERALSAVMPSHEDFPYTVRIVSETLESNGSSSMASICGGCLSLLDAGVPITAPVAGIAMGLIQDGNRVAILSDILGDEDHLGDMDFKVAGTPDGITALQMDIKIPEVDWEVMRRALAQAREGRLHILDCMRKDTASELGDLAPRTALHEFAPRMEVIWIKPDRIRDVIGPGGKVIRAIQETTGAKIDIEDSGRCQLFGPDAESVTRAKSMVEELTQEAEIGRMYMAKVKRITDFGAFAEIFPGTDGLIHISHLAVGRVEKVTDVVEEGDEVLVKCIDIDPTGRIRLSRKEAIVDAENGAGAA